MELLQYKVTIYKACVAELLKRWLVFVSLIKQQNESNDKKRRQNEMLWFFDINVLNFLHEVRAMAIQTKKVNNKIVKHIVIFVMHKPLEASIFWSTKSMKWYFGHLLVLTIKTRPGFSLKIKAIQLDFFIVTYHGNN